MHDDADGLKGRLLLMLNLLVMMMSSKFFQAAAVSFRAANLLTC